MKIHDLRKSHLRNDEHFQFHTEFLDLLTGAAAIAAKVQPLFARYQTLYAKEDEGLKKIKKSALTARIHEEDRARDELYAAMADMNTSTLRHPQAEKRAAAERLKILFDTYGPMYNKTLNEQTSSIVNIMQELKGGYAADVAKTNLSEYVALLESHNNALETLIKQRDTESAAKSDVVLRAVRAEVDAVYDNINKCIEAFTLLEGDAPYGSFIRAFNVVIGRYEALLNARAGRKHNKHGVDGQGSEAEEPETDGEEGGNI